MPIEITHTSGNGICPDSQARLIAAVNKTYMETILYIKNMVCDRCIMAVEDVLKNLGHEPAAVELGRAVLLGNIGADTKEKIRSSLARIGFELLDDKNLQTIEKIKSSVIALARQNSGTLPNLSDFVAGRLGSDYSALSKLFSGYCGMTIERYYILQRVERVKELLFYGEMSLSEIAVKMNYSSVAYLSAQFKNVTGMTASQFRASKRNSRRPLDKIL